MFFGERHPGQPRLNSCMVQCLDTRLWARNKVKFRLCSSESSGALCAEALEHRHLGPLLRAWWVDVSPPAWFELRCACASARTRPFPACGCAFPSHNLTSSYLNPTCLPSPWCPPTAIRCETTARTIYLSILTTDSSGRVPSFSHSDPPQRSFQATTTLTFLAVRTTKPLPPPTSPATTFRPYNNQSYRRLFTLHLSQSLPEFRARFIVVTDPSIESAGRIGVLCFEDWTRSLGIDSLSQQYSKLPSIPQASDVDTAQSLLSKLYRLCCRLPAHRQRAQLPTILIQ
jgi:hypothetical protein